MLRQRWAFGLALFCAAAFASPMLNTIATATEASPAGARTKIILEPELPPDIEASPPTLATSPSRADPDGTEPPAAKAIDAGQDEAAKDAPRPLEAKNGDAGARSLARSDPEVGAPPLPPGATPADIADALDALPPAERKQSLVLALRDWRAAREDLIAFYAGRADIAIWTGARGFNQAGRAVIARLKRADDDGLNLSGLDLPDPDARIDDPTRLAKAEISVAQGIVAYAFQASGGRIDPARISPLITAKAEVISPLRALSAVATATDPDAALEGFNPPQKGYRDLRDQLARLRASLGDLGSNVEPQIDAPQDGRSEAKSLIRAGFDTVDASDRRPRRSQIAANDVARQRDAPTSGRVLTSTEELAAPAARALEANVLANMEMWRWEPRDMGEERIEINVADFTLKVVRGDETLHRARIIVGKPDTQTPIFSNAMRYILVNPSWSVPVSIIKKEMLPKLAEDPDYLTRQGYEVTEKGGMIQVRQPPGERNALGRIAFMFPNEHSVYLHDTPARGLFTAQRRAFSHGCVRVDQPMRLAQLVMGAGWSEQRLRSLIGGDERTIFLPRPLPIHIEYFTAFVDDAGTLQTREDVYGHARRVESALGVGG
jgi:L,D-transpeptidase YcbB